MPASRRFARLHLECLEDRCVPALIFWNGLASSDWNTAANWSLGRVPTLADDVYVVAGNLRSPTLSSGVGQAGTLTASSLSVTGGTLKVQDTAKIGTLSFSGGSLRADGLEVQSLVWSGGVFGGAGVVQLPGTATLSGTLGVDGVEVVNDGVAAWGGGKIIAGNGGSFRNAGTLSVTASAAMDGPLSNDGLLALAAGRTLTVTGDYTQSTAGTLRVNVPIGGTAALLDVQGNAWLGGTLDVRLTGPAPKSIMGFPIVTMDSASGSFDAVSVTPVLGAKATVVSAPREVAVVVTPVLIMPVNKVPLLPETDPIPVPIPSPTPAPLPAPDPDPVPAADDDIRPGVSGGPSPAAAVQAAGAVSSVIVAAARSPSPTGLLANTQPALEAGPVMVAAPSGKRAATPDAGAAGAAEELRKAEVFLDVVPVMPELPPPSGLDAGEMLASLLVGGPARASVVGRSLSAVAAVLPDEGGPAPVPRAGDDGMASLLVAPAGRLGDWEAPPAEDPVAAPVAADEVFEDGPSMLSLMRDAAAPVAFVGLACAAALAAVHTRPPRPKRKRRAT